MINIIQGSIFDSKCDLMIVPCDSSGGVTQSVYSDLHIRKLLVKSVGAIPYGKVFFHELNYTFASTIGFAASVDALTSTSNENAIKSVAEEIVKYARQNEIRIINIPLLGSGAGGLTPLKSFKSLESIFANEDDITFNIFCIAKEAFRNIVANYSSTPKGIKLKCPRVFISYAGNDKDNSDWVKSLAQELRSNGVDARLDVFHLKPGFDLPQWMTNEVVMADKVLLICDKYYIEKADIRRGGVGWETMIIQGDMLAQGDNKQKYIAIIREDEVEKGLPIYMRSKFAFVWKKTDAIDGTQKKELILRLFDCDIEPELGPIPDYVLSSQKSKATKAIHKP